MTAFPCDMGIGDIVDVSGKHGDTLKSECSAPAFLPLLSELTVDLRVALQVNTSNERIIQEVSGLFAHLRCRPEALLADPSQL